MADVALRVVGIGKQYRIGGRTSTAWTLRETVANVVRSPFAGLRAQLRRAAEHELFWALQDVSFELERGRVLGVIGRNGAGKSTLLKLLARITEPTEGYADVYGRLASLLEVGTGFHEELTGRENVFLNGAILGMRRVEVARKFDRIVEFAGVEKFIDMPVKRYSTGMYLRLAFAVAAHLEPDILVVDEVLAVGDAEFQRRSLSKMREVTSEGHTVVFVSHNLASVRSLCEQAILLENGRIRYAGSAENTVDEYLRTLESAVDTTDLVPREVDRSGSGVARLAKVKLLDDYGRALNQIHLAQQFTVSLSLESAVPLDDAVVEVGISTLDGTRVVTTFSTDEGGPVLKLPAGLSSVRVDIDVVLLPGWYTLDVGLHHAVGLGQTIDYVGAIYDFEALAFDQDGRDQYRATTGRGFVRPTARWHASAPVEVVPSPSGAR